MRIPLSTGDVAVGRELNSPAVAFYDARGWPTDEQDVASLLQGSKPLFVAWVDDKPLRERRWPEVDLVPLTEEERVRPIPFFKQDRLSGKLTRYWSDPTTSTSHEVPITLDEAKTLEPAAVWSAEHIEERLADLFAGRPNRWVEVLAPKAEKGQRSP